MRIYFDTEFLENGVTIRLISIGMIREDNKTYYAIVDDLNLMADAVTEPWLKENVLRHLPLDTENLTWDESHPDFEFVKPTATIAKEVHAFIVEHPWPSLWAWFSSYDHVALAQLYGKMIHLPSGIPMRTNDLMQEVERLGLYNKVPMMPGVHSHNALSDAEELKYRYDWLKGTEKGLA